MARTLRFNRLQLKIAGLTAIPLAAALALSGCGEGTDAGEGSDLSQVQSALSTISGGSVELPQSSRQDIGPKINSACFLTGIGGRFEGGGEWGQVANENGRWIVRASSQQVCDVTSQSRCPLYVAASCIDVPYSATGSWSKGQPATLLQTGGSCFLTRVSGKFVGGGESVKTYLQNGNWYLSGSSQTEQSISASAACVRKVPIITPVTNWAADDWDLRLLYDPNHPATKACFLQGVHGGMRSGNEQVDVTHGSSTNFFHLSGTSRASSSNHLIGATAGCIGDEGV